MSYPSRVSVANRWLVRLQPVGDRTPGVVQVVPSRRGDPFEQGNEGTQPEVEYRHRRTTDQELHARLGALTVLPGSEPDDRAEHEGRQTHVLQRVVDDLVQVGEDRHVVGRPATTTAGRGGLCSDRAREEHHRDDDGDEQGRETGAVRQLAEMRFVPHRTASRWGGLDLFISTMRLPHDCGSRSVAEEFR